MPYLLPLVLLPLSLYLIFFIHSKVSRNTKVLPPGSEGWPVLGENVQYGTLGSQQFVETRMEKHSSDIFKTSLLGEKMAVLCGARGNRFAFTNDNKLVTSWLPPSVRKILLPDFDEDNYKEPLALFRNFQYEILKPEALKQYIPIMDKVARQLLDQGWRHNSVVKVFSWSKKYTFELACRVFMNMADPERVERLLEPYTLLSDGMVSLPIDFPGTAFNRAIRGAKVVRSEVMEIVKERRKLMREKEAREGGDVLSKLLLIRNDRDGEYLSDAIVVDIVVGLLFASQFTTSSAVSAVISFLAELPHIYDAVLKEQMEVAKSKGPDEALTWQDVEKMKYSWNVVRESLRLVPPAPGGFREATAEFTYAGFTVPKGWKTFWTTHSSHKNPNYFPEPEKFDPSRFEGRGPPPYTFVPFGGGPYMCPGKDFVKVAILVVMHNVVTRFRLEKVVPNEKMVFRGRATPAHGLPVRLHSHNN